MVLEIKMTCVGMCPLTKLADNPRFEALITKVGATGTALPTGVITNGDWQGARK